MVKALTDFAIKNIKAEACRRELPAGARGLYLVVQTSGVKSFVVRYRMRGKPQKLTLGRWQSPADINATKTASEPRIGEPLSLAGARKLAADTFLKIERGVDPAKEKERPGSLKIGGAFDPSPDVNEADREQKEPGLLDIFVERYCRKEAKLRSSDLIATTLARLVAPEIGDLNIYDLKRSHIVAMLDDIADGSGPVMADRTLAYVRKAFNWQMTRDDKFNSPIIRGMARTKPKERSRKRILADDEIRDLWAGLAKIKDPTCYSSFVKSMLLCATRRNESSRLHTSEFEGDLWTIPGGRYKTKLDHVIPLTDAAKVLFHEKPAGANGNSWFVFSTTGGAKPFSGFSKAKVELDKAIADIRIEAGRAPMSAWVLHDLRRTARSLMSRAKVPTDHAERALGHVMGGVRETYDRYEYLKEKREAFAKLAELVERILQPLGKGFNSSGRGIESC